MQLKGIIFDFDGTLADTLPVIFTAFRHCLHMNLGKEYTEQELADLFGPTEEGIIKALVPEGWEKCYADYLQEYCRHHPKRPFEHIEQALQLLQENGVRLAIGTGKGRGSLMASLGIIGLESYFDILEVGSDTGAIKPEIIERILCQWNLTAKQVAYIGDAPSDVTASRQAGVLALSAAWSSVADLSGIKAAAPDAIFTTVAEFIQWLKPRLESAKLNCAAD